MKSKEITCKKYVKNNPYHIKVNKKHEQTNKEDNRKMNHYSSTKQIANQKTKKNRVKVAGIKKEEANIKNNYSENEINNHINYKKITTNNWDRNNIRNNYCYTINHRDMDTLSQGKTNKTNIIKNSVIDDEIDPNGIISYKTRKTQYSLCSDKRNNFNSINNVDEDFRQNNKNLQLDSNENISPSTNNIININNNISSKHYIMSPCYTKKNFMKRFAANNTSITRTKKTQSNSLVNNNYINAQYFTSNLENYFFSPPHQENSNQTSENISIITKSKNNTDKKDDYYKTLNYCPDQMINGIKNIENYQSNTYEDRNENDIVYDTYTGKLFNSNLTKFIYANKILCRGSKNSSGKVRNFLISNDNPKQYHEINSNENKNNKLLISIYKGKLIKIFVKFLKNYCTYFCKRFYSDFFYGLKNYIYKRRFKKTITKKPKSIYNNRSKYDVITTTTSNYSDNNGNFSTTKSKEIQMFPNNLYNSLNSYFNSERKKNCYDNNDTNQDVCSARNKKILNQNKIYVPKFQSNLESSNNSIENRRQNFYPKYPYAKMNKSNTINCFSKDDNKRFIYNNKNKQKILSIARNFQIKEIKTNLEDSNNSLNTSSKNSNIHNSCRKPINNTQYNLHNSKNIIEKEKEPKNIIYRKKIENINNSINSNHNIQKDEINHFNNNNFCEGYENLQNSSEKNLQKYIPYINSNNNKNNNINLKNHENNIENNFCLEDIDKPLDLVKHNTYLPSDYNIDNPKDINYYKSSDGLLSIRINYITFNYNNKNKKIRIKHRKTSSYKPKKFMCLSLYSFDIIGKKKFNNNFDSPIVEIAELEGNIEDTESNHKNKRIIKDKNNLKRFIENLENIFDSIISKNKMIFFNFLRQIAFKCIMEKILNSKKMDFLRKYFDIYKSQSNVKKNNNVVLEDIDSDLDNEKFIINNIDNNVMMDDDFDLEDIENNGNHFGDKNKEISENEDENEDMKKSNHIIEKIQSDNNTKRPVYSKKKVFNVKQNNEIDDKNRDSDIKGTENECDKKFEDFMEVIRLELISFALSKKK